MGLEQVAPGLANPDSPLWAIWLIPSIIIFLLVWASSLIVGLTAAVGIPVILVLHLVRTVEQRRKRLEEKSPGPPDGPRSADTNHALEARVRTDPGRAALAKLSQRTGPSQPREENHGNPWYETQTTSPTN